MDGLFKHRITALNKENVTLREICYLNTQTRTNSVNKKAEV